MSNYSTIKSSVSCSSFTALLGAVTAASFLFLSNASGTSSTYRGALDFSSAPPNITIARISQTTVVLPIEYSVRSYALPDWVKYIQSLGLDEPNPNEVAKVFIGINTHVIANDYVILDRILRLADIGSMSDAMIVSLARGTFAYRKLLPSWHGYISRTKSALVLRGMDAEKILKGMNV
jgi:hypothetical protein